MKGSEINLDQFFDTTRVDIENKISTTVPDAQIVDLLKGGKRLRSLLAQLSFKACTEGKDTHEEYQKSLEGSVSIELAHGASLVHDDIIDKDVERRGRPSLHIKEGIGKALLTGHKMLAHGFNIALSHGNEVAQVYVDSWNKVVSGEINEVEFNSSSSGSMSAKDQIFEAYNKIIDLKTAELFSSACVAGALEANMTGEILKVFSDYGREIGMAYQLADDLVDLANGEILDSVIIPLVNRLDSKAKKITRSLKKWEIKRKFEKNKDEIYQLYIKQIKEHVKKAEELGESGIIPKSLYKDLLTDAPTYIINKMLGEINITI